jgi:hypothetical protein
VLRFLLVQHIPRQVTDSFETCVLAAAVLIACHVLNFWFILLASTFDGRYSTSKLPSLEDWGRCGGVVRNGQGSKTGAGVVHGADVLFARQAYAGAGHRMVKQIGMLGS